MRPAQQPANFTTGIGLKLSFDQVKIDPKLAIDLRCEALLQQVIEKERESAQNGRGDCGVPKGQPEPHGASFPPANHVAGSARRTKPMPRTVWMSFTPKPSSIFRRR